MFNFSTADSPEWARKLFENNATETEVEFSMQRIKLNINDSDEDSMEEKLDEMQRVASCNCIAVISVLFYSIKNYKKKRENPTFFESLFYNKQLTEDRLSMVVSPLINFFREFTPSSIEFNVYKTVVGKVSDAMKLNGLLTFKYESGGGELENILATALKNFSMDRITKEY